MKRLLIALLMLAVAIPADAGKKSSRKVDPTKEPGYVEFDDLDRYMEGEATVEVHLTQPLLKLAEEIIRQQMIDEDPELAALPIALHLVHVNVFEYDVDNEEGLETSFADLSRKLTNDGWQRLVKVRDDEQSVYLYILPEVRERDGEEVDLISGVVVLVLGDGGRRASRQAVFVNIVGDFDIEAMVYLVQHFSEDVPDLDMIEGMGNGSYH